MSDIRTLLVDDERLGRSRLRHLLGSQPDVFILEECANGTQAIEAIRRHRPDLVFLDIQMPGLDGFDVLEALAPEEQPTVVVFVTAYDAHAVRAFETCALDYLLKPASPERLAKALERVREQLRLRSQATEETVAGTEDADEDPAAAPLRFMVRSGGRVTFVHPAEILWIEAAGNYAILHTERHHHMLRETMSSLEATLEPRGFLRASRSAIVNLRKVSEVVTQRDGKHAVQLRPDELVPITRPRREILQRLADLPSE